MVLISIFFSLKVLSNFIPLFPVKFKAPVRVPPDNDKYLVDISTPASCNFKLAFIIPVELTEPISALALL